MMFRRFLPFVAVLALAGAGCVPSFQKTDAPRFSLPEEKPAPEALPCLTFEHREGFAAWLDAYEAGTEDAVSLAQRARLPEHADKKLINDMRMSLNTGALPSFVCSLSADGTDAAWVMEPTAPEGTECRDMFYVSVGGLGTTSDLSSTGRTTDCRKLCKPKRWEPDLLVWQCDMREKDGKKEWSQMHMNRKDGKIEIIKCQKDSLGIPAGCLE